MSPEGAARKKKERGPKEAENGPLLTLLNVLAGPWTMYLAWILLTNGSMRFGELRRRIPGISSKVLTDRLRMLERQGLAYRRYAPTTPPQVSYEATSRLRELSPVLKGFRDMAERWHREGDK